MQINVLVKTMDWREISFRYAKTHERPILLPMMNQWMAIAILVFSCCSVALTADDITFSEDPNNFTPTPSNARLLIVTAEGYIWRTDGKGGPPLITCPVYPRYYFQKHLGEKASFLYEITFSNYSHQAELIGGSLHGLLFRWKDAFGRRRDRFRNDDCQVEFIEWNNSDELLKTNMPKFAGDIRMAWPVNYNFPGNFLWDKILEMLSRGEFTMETLKTAGPEIPFLLNLELHREDMTNRHASIQLMYNLKGFDTTAWENLRNSQWMQARKLWPIANISSNVFLIWNGEQWTNLVWTTNAPVIPTPRVKLPARNHQ